MGELLRRVWYLLNRKRLEREMAEEMDYHRELMPADRGFGSELRLREDTREVWGWGWLDRLRQDLSYGARVLRKSMAFTLTAILVLGLGIGVPLTALRAVLDDLRAGAPPDPDTMVHLTRRAPGVFITTVPYPELVFYSEHAQSFRSVIGVSSRTQAVLGDSERVHLSFVSANYFPEFGMVPVRGRLLTDEDDRPGAEPVALVAYAYWQRRLGGDLAVLGRSLRVNGKPLRIVGVLPASVKTTDDVWLPLRQQPYAIEGSTLLSDWNSALDVYARLRPGVSPKSAEQETLALAAALRAQNPDQVRAGEYLDARPILEFENHNSEYQVALTAALLVLLLLVVACANLGTLVLARGVTREREIRIRMALGASRPRVVRQLFTEALLLATLSGACALILSTVVLKVIQLEHNPDSALLPDWRALAATFGISLLAALVFGLPPALRLTSLVPRAGRARTVFLVVQVAASCLLLVVSTLLTTNLQRLSASDPGFDFRHLVSISPGLKEHGYDAPAAQTYLETLRERADGLPGVTAASVAWLGPWGDLSMGAVWQGHQLSGNRVDAKFLETMGMRLLRGRNFLPGENGVMISEAAERLIWPARDSLGKTLPWDPQGPTVIAVVRDASTASLGNPEPLEFYLPHSHSEAASSVVIVRVSGDPHHFVRRLQESARALDQRLQPTVQVLTDVHDRAIEGVTRVLAVISILGVVAILLSAIGLAGLAGYAVTQRTREIGLRMALGAQAGQVVRATLAPLLRPLGAGFLCGALGASATARVLRSGWAAAAGLQWFDPVAYLIALVFFVLVVAVAVFSPVRRAIRIDPVRALQHE